MPTASCRPGEGVTPALRDIAWFRGFPQGGDECRAFWVLFGGVEKIFFTFGRVENESEKIAGYWSDWSW